MAEPAAVIFIGALSNVTLSFNIFLWRESDHLVFQYVASLS